MLDERLEDIKKRKVCRVQVESKKKINKFGKLEDGLASVS